MGIKVPGDIVETKEDNWIPVITIFDTESQHIFVRKDHRFGDPEHIMKVIQGGLRDPILALYNHRVFVEGKTKTEHFWRIISKHQKIYKLELNLISPNILETNLRAREALAALKSLFAQDEVSVKLENEAGELRVPKDPVGNYLEYIEEGEGSWSVTTENSRGGKKRHSSAQNTETIDLPIIEEQDSPEIEQLDIDELSDSTKKANIVTKIISIIYDEVSKIRER